MVTSGGEAAPRRERRGRLALLLLLAATVVAVGTLATLEIRHNALSIDGALNAQVPLHLMEQGRYATSYRWMRDFDHRITTGPTVLLPAWLSFEVLGPTTTAAQAPNAVYLVLLAALVVLWTHRHAGLPAALAAAVLLLTTPRLLDIGLRLYGEVPALAFLLAALILLDRLEAGGARRAATALALGLAVGLAVVTKTVLVLALPGLVLAAVLDRLTGATIRGRHWLLVAAGVVLPSLAMAAVKLAVLGVDRLLGWWRIFGGRAATQAVPGYLEDTPGLVDKVRRHLAYLAGHLRVEPEMALVLVVVPVLVVAAGVVLGRLHRRRTVALSVVVAAATVGCYFTWWLALTPTARAWYRRIFNGVVLAELLAALVIGWLLAWLVGAWRRRSENGAARPLVVAAVTGPGLLLLLVVATMATGNLRRLEVRTAPDEERLGIEEVASVIRELPEDARLYGYGWFEAPNLAFASRRQVLDLLELPADLYDRRLDDAYLVADRYLTVKKPEMLESILSGLEVEPVASAGGSAVWRLRRVSPYAPLPEVPAVDEVPTSFEAGRGDRRLTRGVLARAGGGGRWIRVVSAYLLRREGMRCLTVDLVAPQALGTGAELEVLVDGASVHRSRLEVGRQVVVTTIPSTGRKEDPLTVELRLHRGRRSPLDFSLFGSPEAAVLHEIRFGPCA